MAKKIRVDAIKNELEESAFFQQKQEPKPKKTLPKPHVVVSPVDVVTSDDDITTSNVGYGNAITQPSIDTEKLEVIIKSLSEIKTSSFTTPIRLTEQEKKDIEDFIYIKLRKKGLQGKNVSISKLMRYSMRYMLKIHEAELEAALQSALVVNSNLPI